MEKLVKVLIGFFVLIFVGLIFLRINLVYNASKDGKKIYEIQVNNYKQVETYVTNEYVRDKETGCIKFKDEFGIKRVVCNNYTITEF
jgi:hypothetical protein